jgi:cytoskeleton protein RodZ
MNDAVPATAAPGAPGPQLKAEREKRGMSLQKAADELHLDPWVIEALESGDYPRIGPTVYAKGHLKRYAGLLGLPAAAIMAGYEARGTPAHAVTLTSQSARMAGAAQEPPLSNLSPGRTLGFAALAVVLVGVFWWQPWHQRSKAAAPAEAAVNVPAPVVSSDAAPVNAETATTPALETTPAATPKTASVVARDVPATAAPVGDANAATQPGAGRARLRLSFSADSWVDVHDANGKRAFSGNGLANSVKTITGTAPMHVYLGSANGVALEINDRTVVIGRQFFAGNVARFEAGADGVLRPDAQARPARPRG